MYDFQKKTETSQEILFKDSSRENSTTFVTEIQNSESYHFQT